MSVRILRDAEEELARAIADYDSEVTGLGMQFLDEVERCIEQIEQFPEAYSPLSEMTRRCLLRRFPFAIIYTNQLSHQARKQNQDPEILILAIAHLHRRFGYWVGRS